MSPVHLRIDCNSSVSFMLAPLFFAATTWICVGRHLSNDGVKEFVLVFVEDDRIDAGLAHIHRLEMDARTIDGAVRAMAELDIELDKLKR